MKLKIKGIGYGNEWAPDPGATLDIHITCTLAELLEVSKSVGASLSMDVLHALLSKKPGDDTPPADEEF